MDTNFPKKSLGQHWLDDEAALEAMCQAADVTKDDTVLEIGPGLGSLTSKLVKRAKQVIAVEFDSALAATLAGKIKADNLTVIQADILRFDFNSLPAGYKLVANIPYYLTSNLLRVLSESGNPFSIAVLLVQKEVAERVAAKPGAMSILSVSVQFYCEVSLGREVAAALFTPPPKVDSQILKLTFRPKPLFPGVDRAVFFHLVKAGFSQRRKTLLNSLSGGLRLDRGATLELLQKSNLSPALRAQSLSLEDWHRLYETYQQLTSF
jgi:16S rRNA (adenine1518-N6/adenine1519-N6)-dimethyltransferase